MQTTLREDDSCINQIETISQNIQSAAVGFLQDLNTSSKNSLVKELKTILIIFNTIINFYLFIFYLFNFFMACVEFFFRKVYV